MSSHPVTSKSLGKKGDERAYAFSHMSATEAWDVLTILGPAVIGAMLGVTKGDAFSPADVASLGGALRSLDRKDFAEVRDKLLRSVTLAGKEISNLDMAFTGRPLELLQVLGEALRKNFADFLAVVPSPSSETPAPT
jgi:hypothetical protein